jgi:hypothetical protein
LFINCPAIIGAKISGANFKKLLSGGIKKEKKLNKFKIKLQNYITYNFMYSVEEYAELSCKYCGYQ